MRLPFDDAPAGGLQGRVDVFGAGFGFVHGWFSLVPRQAMSIATMLGLNRHVSPIALSNFSRTKPLSPTSASRVVLSAVIRDTPQIVLVRTRVCASSIAAVRHRTGCSPARSQCTSSAACFRSRCPRCPHQFAQLLRISRDPIGGHCHAASARTTSHDPSPRSRRYIAAAAGNTSALVLRGDVHSAQRTEIVAGSIQRSSAVASSGQRLMMRLPLRPLPLSQ